MEVDWSHPWRKVTWWKRDLNNIYRLNKLLRGNANLQTEGGECVTSPSCVQEKQMKLHYSPVWINTNETFQLIWVKLAALKRRISFVVPVRVEQRSNRRTYILSPRICTINCPLPQTGRLTSARLLPTARDGSRVTAVDVDFYWPLMPCATCTKSFVQLILTEWRIIGREILWCNTWLLCKWNFKDRTKCAYFI